jgi:hypothetical protein
MGAIQFIRNGRFPLLALFAVFGALFWIGCDEMASSDDWPVDVCDPGPCMNGGVCSDEAGEAFCTCPEYAYGDSCECLPDPLVVEPFRNVGSASLPRLLFPDFFVEGSANAYLSLNGLGIQGGGWDDMVDRGESIVFRFGQPVVDVVLHGNSLSCSGTTSQCGSGSTIATVDPLDESGVSLGAFTLDQAGGIGIPPADVTGPYGDTPIIGFGMTVSSSYGYTIDRLQFRPIVCAP